MLKLIPQNNNPKKLHKQLKLYYNKEEQLINLQGNKEWMIFLQCRKWTGIKQLWLGQCDINDIDIGAIAMMNWQDLQELRLHDNKIGSGGMKKLVINSWPKLRLLSLCRNELGDEGCVQILSLYSYFTHLDVFNLDSNNISGAGLGLMPAIDFGQLFQLSLDSNNVGHRGIKYLTKAKIPKLKRLFLGFCHIGNEGVKHLIKGQWPQLEQLRIVGNQINSVESLSLLDSYWPKIKIVNIQGIYPIHLYHFVDKILKDKLLIDQEIKNYKIRRQFRMVLGLANYW